MQATGIIAEYNPFHNGHLYHLQKTKEALPENKVISVMSGHFLQRGEPALLNKWARAEIAVAQGVDLVLELPVLYSCRSAYWFARGGLEVLNATGVVTHLSFGAEEANLSILRKAAAMLACETPEFSSLMREALNEGMSYPKARATALSQHFDCSESLWNKPNNVLAIAYLQVLQELGLPIIPLAIKREGSGYLESILITGQNASATAIRSALTEHPCRSFPQCLTEIQEYLPAMSAKILLREYNAGRCPVQLEAMASQVLTLLRRSTPEELSKIIEVREGLENRLLAAANSSTTLTGFLADIKTKRYTYTRLQRFLCHLLIRYTKDLENILAGSPPYLRILAFNSEGTRLLKEIKSKTNLHIITKGSRAGQIGSVERRFSQFWEMDVLAGNLYSLLYPSPKARAGGADYYNSPVQADDPRES